jgi:hypothetical protein
MDKKCKKNGRGNHSKRQAVDWENILQANHRQNGRMLAVAGMQEFGKVDWNKLMQDWLQEQMLRYTLQTRTRRTRLFIYLGTSLVSWLDDGS